MTQLLARSTAIALLLFALAEWLPAQLPPPLRLTTVATYGSTGLSDSTKPLSVTDRRLLAGELGSANGAVEGLDGQVIVLDGVNRKVAVFDRKGVFLRAFGGTGEGPGEFRRPTRIVGGPNGSIYVWDPQLMRISQFTVDGRSLSQRLLPLASTVSDFTVVNGRAWFVRLLLHGGSAVRAFDLTSGAVVDSFAPLTEREVAISAFGAPGSITSNAVGEITFAGPFPVELRIWSNNKVRTAGSNRFPGARGIASDNGVRNTPISMRGITVRPDGSFAVVYSTSDISPEKISAPLKFFLEILAPDGTSRGRAELSGVERVGGISATANGDLLIGVAAEYPQVRRVRVSVGPN